MTQSIWRFLFADSAAQPNNAYDRLIVWVFFSIPFVFSGAEISLSLAALLGFYLWAKEGQNFWHNAFWQKTDSKIYLALSSIFLLKLLSALWAETPHVALRSSMTNVHFLLWPIIVAVFYKATNPMLAMTQGMTLGAIATAIWGIFWMVTRLLNGIDVSLPPFEAGAQNAGILAHVICVYTLWLLSANLLFTIHLNRQLLQWGFFAAFLVLLCSTRRIQLVIFFIVAAPMILIYLHRHLTPKRLVQTMAISMVLFISAIWLMTPKFEQAYHEASNYLSHKEPKGKVLQTSIGNRLEYYHIATSAVAEQPILGYGAGIKPIKLSRFSHDAGAMSQYGHFHNQYLQTLVEVGWLGATFAITAFLFLLYQLVFRTWQKDIKVACGFFVLFSVYLLTGLFSISLGQGVVNSMFVLMCAALWAQRKHTTHPSTSVNSQKIITLK